MAKYSSKTGRGGKSMNDRELAAEVRTLVLKDIRSVLKNEDISDWNDYKKSLVLNLSKSILPRLNEHSGEGGGPIKMEGVEISFRE